MLIFACLGRDGGWGESITRNLNLLLLRLGKVALTNGGFRKLTEVPVNERQKLIIFKR